MELSAGKTLLVDGPAAIKLFNGVASIFGCKLKPGKTYLLRPWRRYPIYAEQETKMELNLGADSRTEVLESGDTVQEWKEIIERVEDRKVLAVCGRVDSGKTSFTTLAANLLTAKHGKCVVVSLDPGQSYFTPPTVVGASVMNEPVHDLAQLKPFIQIPVGSTSAASCASTIADAAEEISKSIPDNVTVVVDVDGWVDGALAISHKTLVLKILGCSSAVLMGNDPEPLGNSLSNAGISVETAPISLHIKQRDSSERKKTREWLYRKFLGKPTLKLIPTTWASLETVCRKVDPLAFFSEAKNAVTQILNMSHDDRKDIESASTKRRIGLIAYIYDFQNQYHGFGLFLGLSREKNVYKILSAAELNIGRILLGRVVLSEEGDEILQLD